MIQCFNYKTKELKIYDSIETACQDLEISKSKLLRYNKKKHKLNYTSIIFIGNIPEEVIYTYPIKKFTIKNIKTNKDTTLFTLQEIQMFFQKTEKQKISSDRIYTAIRNNTLIINKYYITKTHGNQH